MKSNMMIKPQIAGDAMFWEPYGAERFGGQAANPLVPLGFTLLYCLLS